MKKSVAVLLIVLALAVGAFLGVCYATGSLPFGEVNLAHQARTMQQLGELSWYIQSFNYEEMDPETLYVGGARGMVYALDDIYAAYYTGDEFAQLMQEQSGCYVGIGITISGTEGGDIEVVGIVEGSPAERAGLNFGDVLAELDGESLSSLTGEQISIKIQEKGEESFVLSVRRGKETLDFTLKSEEVVSHRVHYEMENGLMWIRLDSFTGDAVEGIQEALNAAKEQNARGLILDLRDNPGGDLDVVLDIANFFLDGQLIMTMRTRSGKETVYSSDPGKETELPLAVLINGNSASASEVLAGALQDHGKAEIIGTKSFGKGVVQSIYPLQMSDGHVKMTTAAYFTPSGKSIHEIGIEPDMVVELAEKYENVPVGSVPIEDDEQLAAAVAYLGGDAVEDSAA